MLLPKYRSALEKLGLSAEISLWEKAFDAADQQREAEVLVMGEFNHGKSSLINMLVGNPILRVGMTPTTRVETRIRFGALHDVVRVHALGGHVREIGLDEFKKSEPKDALRLEVELASQRFPAETVFIDTPGLNEAHALREDLVQDLVGHASLVLYLLDASQPATRHECHMICETLNQIPAEKRAIVVNKCDRLDDDELLEICAYVEKTLYPPLLGEPFYFVSAKKAGYAGNSTLLERITASVEKQKAFVRKEAIDRVTFQFKAHIQLCEWFARACDMMRSEHIKALRLALEEERATYNSAEDRIHAIQNAFDALNARFTEELDAFELRFNIAIVREIDKAMIDDVETYLDGFIIDEYKKWLLAQRQTLTASIANIYIDAYYTICPIQHESKSEFMQKLSLNFSCKAIDSLLNSQLERVLCERSDLAIDHIERIMRLPGIYKYRVENARSRAHELISNCAKLARETVLNSIDAYKKVFVREFVRDPVIVRQSFAQMIQSILDLQKSQKYFEFDIEDLLD